MADKNYLHTAYSNSADGTDGFTTVYPNLNLLVNSSAKTKDGFFKNFDKVENGYGEVTIKGTNRWVSVDLSDGFSIQSIYYKPNDNYTMSMDIMFTNWNLPAGTTLKEFWIGQQYVNDEGTKSWQKICSIELSEDPSQMLNQWIRITQTSTIPSYADISVVAESSLMARLTGPSEGSFTFRIRKPKQEFGSIATPWMPSSSEVTSKDYPTYIGTYTDENETSSTDPADYTWERMNYRIYLDGIAVAGSKLLSTKVENLKPDTSYTIQVKQVSGEEESDFSDSVTFKTNVQK